LSRVKQRHSTGRFGRKRPAKRSGKREFEAVVHKKGAERRKRLEKGFWIFELGQKLLEEAGARLPRAPRGHRRALRPPQGRALKRMPSGRGVSGHDIFVTGKKATGPDELSGGRARPPKTLKTKRHPRRRHRSRM